MLTQNLTFSLACTGQEMKCNLDLNPKLITSDDNNIIYAKKRGGENTFYKLTLKASNKHMIEITEITFGYQHNQHPHINEMRHLMHYNECLYLFTHKNHERNEQLSSRVESVACVIYDCNNNTCNVKQVTRNRSDSLLLLQMYYGYLFVEFLEYGIYFSFMRQEITKYPIVRFYIINLSTMKYHVETAFVQMGSYAYEHYENVSIQKLRL